MFKKLLILFLILSTNLKADLVNEFVVEGNQRISDETIKVYGEIQLNVDYDEKKINEIIKNLYSTNFFENIKVSINNNLLSIFVEEYPQTYSINITGETSNAIKKLILERIKTKPKESFIKSLLNDDINLIKKLYASIGFNFVNVNINVENFSNNRINLIFNIEKGQKSNIKQINFIGDKKIKEKRLRDIIVSEEKKFWKILSKNTFLNPNNVKLDIRLLENYYKSIGYYDVQVLSSNAQVGEDNSTILTYTVNAGNRYKINKIKTNVSEILDKKIFLSLENDYKGLLGKYYSPFKIKKLLDDLDTLIADNDLQFIEHSVNEIIERDNIEIVINIFEGKKVLVEKINIKGNTVTDEAVIRSELLIDEGDPFNNLKLNKSISKLKARNLFGEVSTSLRAGSEKDLQIIDINIEEKPTGEISAGAGIGTNGGSFAFIISENNWLGKGINLSTNIDLSSETFSGGISVINPNYNYSGNSLNYYLNNTKNDKSNSGFKNNIISTGVGTQFEQYKNIYLSPSISFSNDKLEVQDTASESLRKQKGTFSDVTFDYGISYDNRDRVYSPTEGYISIFNQSLPLYADSPYLRNSYQLSSYNTFNQNMIGAFKLYATNITGLNDKDVRLSKRAFLPSSRLRGFEAGKVGPKDGKDFVGGNYAVSSNFELSLPNLLSESTKTDISLFLDFANVWKVDYDKSLDDSNKIRSSTGVIANWSSPVGPMSFVLSQHITKASTDITESFNFRLGTTF